MKIGFCGILGIVFIVLKLTGVIDWAWVLAPIWIPFAVGIFSIAIAAVLDKARNKRLA